MRWDEPSPVNRQAFQVFTSDLPCETTVLLPIEIDSGIVRLSCPMLKRKRELPSEGIFQNALLPSNRMRVTQARYTESFSDPNA